MQQKVVQLRLFDCFERFGSRRAIEYGENNISYGELNRRSEQIGSRITERGIARETFIGIFVEDRLKLVSAILGILKAGCVFVPLDPAYPDDRIAAMIRTIGMKLIVTDVPHFRQLNTLKGGHDEPIEPILLDEWCCPGDAPSSTGSLNVEYTPEDQVYIYFTSGTTGTPRAVVGKNKSLLHFILWEINTFGINEDYKVSQFFNPGFDAFLRDVFVPLCSGGTVSMPPAKETFSDPSALKQWIERTGVQLIHCVPSIFRLFGSNGLSADNFKALKYVLLSGERVYPADLQNWFANLGDRARLVNLWGPTETTMVKTFYLIQKDDVIRERIPVGKPMPGTRVIILDDKLKVCDEQVTGELYIRTPFRTFGYYNDSQLNRQKFIPNPFSNDSHDMLYKTGDLGKLLPDGNLDLLGRIDRQVKIKGIRVELEEIESLLMRHPDVREAAVLKIESSHNNDMLCAYVTGDRLGSMDETTFIDSLRQYLLEKLPVSIVPDKIMNIKEIPRTPNGKIDYKQLTDLFYDEPVSFEPPADELERRLAEIWSELLGIEPVGVNNRFFELGGNSLKLLSLISKIHQEFNVRISLSEMIKSLTVKQQAQIIKEAGIEKYESIKPVEKKDYYPVSSWQKRLYIFQQVEPESVVYHMPQMVSLEGDLGKEKLELVFKELIYRQEACRTSFQVYRGEVVQRLDDGVDFKLNYYDNINGRHRGEDPGNIIETLIRPFDLSRPPLLRVGLIKNEEQKFILVLDIHHIITDGTSISIMVQEFMALYKGDMLSPLKTQYKDYIQWQKSENGLNMLERQKEFWLNEFSEGIPEINLPIDFARPAGQNYEGDRFFFELSEEETESLKTLMFQEDVTMFMLLLALFNIFLSKVTGQEDIIVGTPVANRSRQEIRSVIGLFANTLALRNFPGGKKTFVKFLKELKEKTIRVFENQDYHFEDLVVRLVGEGKQNRNPIFDVQFQFENIEIPRVDIPGLRLRPFGFKDKTAKLDLVLIGAEERKKMVFIMNYKTALFKREKIEKFALYFKRVLSAVLDNPAKKITDIYIMPDERREGLLTQLSSDLENE